MFSSWNTYEEWSNIRCKVHGGYSTGPKTAKKARQDLPII
jgi:hypothetical protein